MTDAAAEAFDLVIVGGGLVGASLAVALRGTDLNIALIESGIPPESAPRWDERCIALNHRSVEVMRDLDLWPGIVAAAVAITATHISERGRFGRVRFTAAEAGLEALGYNIPVRLIGQHIWHAAERQVGVRVYAPATVAAVQALDAGVRIGLDDGRVLQAGLVAAADGALSRVRQALGVLAEVHDYRQTAIVSAIRVQRPQAGMAYERFTPDGPIAVLPKEGDACSLIWTLPSARATAALAMTDADFLSAAASCFGERLGRFTHLGQRSAYPLSQTLSTRLAAPNTVFLGNAAHALHPVAAQGFNLGLRDVAVLAALVHTLPRAAWPQLPDRFAAARQEDVTRTAQFTDQLIRLFSNRAPGLSQLRHWGLLGLSVAAPLRRSVMRQNTGLSVGAR